MDNFECDDCSEETEEGITLNHCEDMPIITYCRKCGSLYTLNADTGERRELPFTLAELLRFIHDKENEGYDI